ncbi:extracellular solute-binding protein [Paenibacillus sp. SYP-B4298]|uniref:extracellular solute-binding protein n=1 Tax=Paenibacillus sp. SYP-B4298 TaxID=2996034 RepID=UPI0022DD66ED|nr:extracellular solute-binding protein [Paenibacillus sp. SYP-B4298]
MIKRKIAVPSVLLATVLSVTLLSACTGTNNGSDNNSPAQTSTAAANETKSNKENGPLTKYSEPIELTTGRIIYDSSWKFDQGKSIDNNFWYDIYRDELNINVKNTWVVNGGDSGAAKINTSIASGDIPDLLRVDASQLKTLVEADMLEDLTTVYDQFASEYTKKQLSSDGGDSLSSATFGGKLYGIPETGSPYDGVPLLWIRTDWLEKLSLKEPTNIEELLAVAKAFVEQDPDGNNTKDTYGIAAFKDIVAIGNPASLEGFFNGYHAYPQHWIENEQGEIVYGSTQPEMKNALAKLAQLYKEGILDKEFGVNDLGKVAESIAAGKIGIMYGPQWTSNWPLQDLKNNQPDADWKQLAVLSADATPASAQVGFSTGSYYVVKKGYKHPEAAIKLLNIILEKKYEANSNPELFNRDIDGSPVEVWKYAAVFPGGDPMKNIVAYHNVSAAVETNDPSSLNSEERIYYDNIVKYKNGDNTGFGLAKIFGENGSFAVIENAYIKQKREKTTKFFGAPTATMVDKQATLKQLEQEVFTKIILGNEPVDAFDSFVEQWNKIGGEQITKEVNEWAKQ